MLTQMRRALMAVLIQATITLQSYAQTPVPSVPVHINPPAIVRMAPPEYSDEGRRAGAFGVVRARVGVGVDGSVSSFKVIRGVGFGLDAMAEKQVRQWKFQPAEKNGVPVAATTTIEVSVGLSEGRPNFGPRSLIFPDTPGTAQPALINVPVKLPENGQEDEPVVLDVEVDAAGNCMVVAVVSGSTAGVDAVSKHVASWRFKPAESEGKPVGMRGRLTFLMGKAAPHTEVELGGGRVIPDLRSPQIIRKGDPQYSREARKAGVSGTVLTQILIGTDGSVKSVHTAHGIGFGLDEMAEKAVRQWQFQPAEREGTPIDAVASIELNFRLLVYRPNFGPNALLFSLGPGVTRPELLQVSGKVRDNGKDADPVVLDLEVDTNGDCKVLSVVSGAPQDGENVSNHVEKWHFQPAEENGKPVTVRGRLRYLLGKPARGFIEVKP